MHNRRTFDFYAGWHFAVCGVIGAAFVFSCFSAFRGFGFQLFYLEKIPGEFILSFLPSHLPIRVAFSTWFQAFDWLAYFVTAALLGLVYRRIFQTLNAADWNTGLVLGAIQWLAFGILIALIEPRLPNGIAFLPADSAAGSPYGFGLAVWILVQNLLFGGFMGMSAMYRRKKAEDFEEETQEESFKKAA